MTEREWIIDAALMGKTCTVPGRGKRGPERLHAGQPLLLIASRSVPAEFRVCLASSNFHDQMTSDNETRGTTDVLCFAIGQRNNRVAALGFGNPHDSQAESGYRHCQLSVAEPLQTFWIFCDAASGWVALGGGARPTCESVLLTSRVSIALRPRLAELSCFMVTNWEAAVTVRTRLETASVAQQCLIELQPARHKFNIDGQLLPVYGVTAVCALPAESELHAIMRRVSHAFATEPALAASYGQLPETSYHMTTMDILSGPRFDGMANVHANSTEAAATATQLYRLQSPAFSEQSRARQLLAASMALRLESAGVLQSVPWLTFAMRAVEIRTSPIVSIELEPWDENVARALEAWRATVAQCTGAHNAPVARSVSQSWVRGQYGLHMTIAYTIFPVGDSVEAREARERICSIVTPMIQSLGPIICTAPHLCHFTSMAAFHPVTMTTAPAHTAEELK